MILSFPMEININLLGLQIWGWFSQVFWDLNFQEIKDIRII